MKFPENISKIASLQPDYLGFIFYEKSPRNLEDTIPYIDKSIQKVGVFVNASIEEILKKSEKFSLDMIQLHGNESHEFCDLAQRHKLKVIKSFQIDNHFDFRELDKYFNFCDYFLFDTKGINYGGNGIAFDWTVLENYKLGKPYFLSGGIGLEHLDNLQSFLPNAIAKGCIAIDCNSKLEVSPGLKSITKTQQLLNAFNK